MSVRNTYGFLRWYDLMASCFEKLTLEEKIDFLLWDANRPPGTRTSDWEGWALRIGPRRVVHPAPWEKRNNLPRSLRDAVFARDGKICHNCGTEKDITIDHVIAVVRGGTDDPENLRPLCRSCNSRKGTN